MLLWTTPILLNGLWIELHLNFINEGNKSILRSIEYRSGANQIIII
jgi:hypothetical protein